MLVLFMTEARFYCASGATDNEHRPGARPLGGSAVKIKPLFVRSDNCSNLMLNKKFSIGGNPTGS